MSSELIGGLLFGAALGLGLAVAAIWLLAGRISPQVSVRLARLFLADLRGTNSQEIFQLFRAREALRQLAASRRSALPDTAADLQPTANSLQPSPGGAQ